MPTRAKRERAAERAKCGDTCYVCGTGPLIRKALRTAVADGIKIACCKKCIVLANDAGEITAEAWVQRMREVSREYDCLYTAAIGWLPRVPVPKALR